jgi:aminoglycoside phosphotransferase (APT) family kinase protein
VAQTGGVRTPSADIEVDQGLVARLVDAQHPDLAGPLRLVTNGWDNAIYRLRDDLYVRLPRRQVAVPLIRNEQRWLPLLAGQVDVPVPVPVRVGVPSAGYPWPWTIGRWHDGLPAADVPPAARAGIAVDLARFLRQLHTPAPADAPHNPVRGVPLAARTPDVRDRLASFPGGDRLRELWDRLSATPPFPGPPVWLHGDLHPANILLTPARELAAVLDFGDLNGGDPATDLAAGWLVFDPAARATFRAHLPQVDPDTWRRARAWALNLGTAIAAHSADNPMMAAIGWHAIEQVLL